jgi:FixJ family two-component response regulator
VPVSPGKTGENSAHRFNRRYSPCDLLRHSPLQFRFGQVLLDAIRQAIQRDRANRKRQAEIAELHARYDLLTQREREVLALVVSGLLNKQIAAQLATSEFTIKIQRSRAVQKMRAGSLAELVRMAEKLGIPSPKD